MLLIVLEDFIQVYSNGYSLSFYDIMESPSKVSVVATSKTDNYQLGFSSNVSSADIQNKLSGILEFDPDGGYGWDFLESR